MLIMYSYTNAGGTMNQLNVLASSGGIDMILHGGDIVSGTTHSVYNHLLTFSYSPMLTTGET